MESCWSKSFRKDFLNQHSIRFHKDMIVFEDYYFVLQCILHKSAISLIPFIGYHYITDLSYNPVARRGFRDLYPSISQLFIMFDIMDKSLGLVGYSHYEVMQIMTNKISVVLTQCIYASKYSEKVKPFKQIANDPTLQQNKAEVMQHAGGRRRLQFKFMNLRLYYISYLLYKYL